MIGSVKIILHLQQTQDGNFSPLTEIGFQKCTNCLLPWFHEQPEEKTGVRQLFQPLLPSHFDFFLGLP